MFNNSSAEIEINGLVKSYGGLNIIPGLTAKINPGEFTVILGPSGCGKSTLLNCIAGLEPITEGTIKIDGVEVQSKPPKSRGIAMVFQNYALYPHMTVSENIGYSLKVAGLAKHARIERVAAAAKVVDLNSYLDRYPSELSGGQRQRVAIARAIVREPKVLLFDEPLSNLDAKLRNDMRMELAKLHKRIGSTSIFVTHDQVEAMTLADRIMILNKGVIEQFDTPDAIYHRPASKFVADFIGSPPMNLIGAHGDGRSLRLSDGTEFVGHSHIGPVLVGVRPEKVSLAQTGVPASVLYREELGSHSVLLLQLPDGSTMKVVSTQENNTAIQDRLHLEIGTSVHLFDLQSGLALT